MSVRWREPGELTTTAGEGTRPAGRRARRPAALIEGDEIRLEFGPGDVVAIPPGHDGEVIGDEPCVILDAAGMEHYAEAR